MPLNLIKTYNSLLELDAFDEEERNASLMGIFKRDFVDSGNYFRQKKVLPTLSQGKNTLSIFFNHLVTMEDRLHRERIYDRNRAVISAGVVFGYYYRMAMKNFGGVTGDLCGYFLQVCELVMALVVVVVDIVVKSGIIK